MFDRVQSDIREAVRSLTRDRPMALLACVVLSVTIAAGTVTFSVVDSVVFQSLPYASPERLVSISPGSGTEGRRPASPRDYFDWLEGAQSLESLAAARLTTGLITDADGVTETLVTRSVTANLFEVLGVQPALGRTFAIQSGADARSAVILSHDVWVRRFAGDRTVVGRQVRFRDGTREVVGVLPPRVAYPISSGPPPDIYVPWLPTAADRLNNRASSVFVVGRLRSNLSVDHARADLARLGPVTVSSLHSHVVGPVRTPLLLVLAAVGVVLLVACVNVATLLLARTAARATELATREALGAPRRRLVRSLMCEGLILGLVSSGAALVLSWSAVEVAKDSLPPGISRVSSIAIDMRVFVVLMVVSVLCGLICSAGPAWTSWRSDLGPIMKSNGSVAVGGKQRSKMLVAFLVADVAFVSLLLVATCLVVTTFIHVSTADLGFDHRNVMTVEYYGVRTLAPGRNRQESAEAMRAELIARARAVPGVEAVAIAMNSGGPLSGGGVRYSLGVPGVGEIGPEDWLVTNMVSSDYFRTMGMHVIRGRGFEPTDRRGTPQVMLINDVAAQRLFPGREPVGQVVSFQGRATTIVGLIRGLRLDGPEVMVPPVMYIPIDQMVGAPNVGALFVRTTNDPRRVAMTVEAAIGPAARGAELSRPRFIDDGFRQITAGRRFNAGLMSVFGVFAVAIALIGVYGTTSFVVGQKIPAIGLRLALGATRAAVMRLILFATLRQVALGTGIGLGAAWLISDALEAFVFGITATNPMVYAAVGGFLAFIGTAGALIPALRASRVDPIVVLRRN